MDTIERSPLFRDDIRQRVEHFARGDLRNGVVGERERSYDHCYNYFATVPRPTGDTEKSCAVLCFYLASWGMYRGSSFLFKETNSRHFIPVIEYIEEHWAILGHIDVDVYDAKKVELIKTAYAELKRLALPSGNSAATLITKILVGVFGCVPAYDTYFRIGIRKVIHDHSTEKFWRFTGSSLMLLSEFYTANSHVVDELHAESVTWRFLDTAPSGAKLTKAKILDMYFFDVGYSG